MKTMRWVVGAALVAALGVAACSKSEDSDKSEKSESAEKTATAEQPAHAGVDEAASKEMFNSRCAACHGPQGLGDGPGAAALNPKPRNYHDKAWQAKVTDDDIKKTILYGGAAVGKSPMMPASPDLDAKPEVVEGLVHIVRAFGKS